MKCDFASGHPLAVTLGGITSSVSSSCTTALARAGFGMGFGAETGSCTTGAGSGIGLFRKKTESARDFDDFNGLDNRADLLTGGGR
jgi:hypothetical protein